MTEPYSLKQTLSDIDLTVQVPKGTSTRDLDIVFKRDQLRVGLKGQTPIIEINLFEMIKVDESTWSLENQKLVLIHLEKVDQYKWWDHLSK